MTVRKRCDLGHVAKMKFFGGYPGSLPYFLFCQDDIKKTCWKTEDRNEARVIQDVAQLTVPSAQTLAIYGPTDFHI